MDPTGRCPCIDGLPDPCTLCGVPADGVCGLDTVVEFEHRAKKAEAELAVLFAGGLWRGLRALAERTLEEIACDHRNSEHGNCADCMNSGFLLTCEQDQDLVSGCKLILKATDGLTDQPTEGTEP